MISPNEWWRKKAKNLLMLMMTFRPKLLERDQITEMLWPELGPEEAHRDLKIAMSTLYKVLEPARKRNTPSAYIVRDGTQYGWRQESDYWLDTQEFEAKIEIGDEQFRRDPHRAVHYYLDALKLYAGDLLQDFPYEEWASEERERLLSRYLTTAERAAQILLEEDEYDQVVEVCSALLFRDRYWESAYRLKMIAYINLGQPALALRTYLGCELSLRQDLSVEPSPATKEIYQSLPFLEIDD